MGGGGSESKSSTTYKAPLDYLPDYARDKAIESAYGYMSMPTSVPIQYGYGSGTDWSGGSMFGGLPPVGTPNIYQMPTKGPLYGAQYLAGLTQTSPTAQSAYSATAPTFCGGSCFMFNETEREEKLRELRRFRDTYFPRGCTVQSGYSKMSRLIIPLMRRSRLFKEFMQLVMTKPLITFARSYYGKNKYGKMFYPLAWMWRNIWWFVGKFVPAKEYTWTEFYEIVRGTRYDNDKLHSSDAKQRRYCC